MGRGMPALLYKTLKTRSNRRKHRSIGSATFKITLLLFLIYELLYVAFDNQNRIRIMDCMHFEKKNWINLSPCSIFFVEK